MALQWRHDPGETLFYGINHDALTNALRGAIDFLGDG